MNELKRLEFERTRQETLKVKKEQAVNKNMKIMEIMEQNVLRERKKIESYQKKLELLEKQKAEMEMELRKQQIEKQNLI